MKKTEIKYILLLLSIFTAYVTFEYYRPKPIDWRVTYAPEDNIPFGGMIMEDILLDHYQDNVENSYQSAYEILDTLKSEGLIILCNYFSPDPEDSNALLKWVSEGSVLFLASEYMDYFMDTLDFELSDRYLDTLNLSSFKEYDSSYLKFVNQEISTPKFWFSKPHMSRYFSNLDSANTTVLAINEEHEPVIVEKSWGKGKIIISLAPMALTNYYLVKEENYKFVDYLFSYIPIRAMHWTQFYQKGRMEPPTPMRFILSQIPLRWAYYLTVGSVLIFIFFRAKRKQRIIPVIQPLKNASQEFTRTLGNLYFHNQDHKNAAEKKITYFLEYLRSHYYMDTRIRDEEFYELLSKKTSKPRNKVDYLFKMIYHIQSRDTISRDQLFELNTKIDEFYSLRQ